MGALAAKDVSKKAKITLTITHLSDENILKKLARYFCEYDTRLSDLTFELNQLLHTEMAP